MDRSYDGTGLSCTPDQTMLLGICFVSSVQAIPRARPRDHTAMMLHTDATLTYLAAKVRPHFDDVALARALQSEDTASPI